MKALAQKVIDLYAQEKSAGDDDLFQALVDLGDQAERIVKLVEIAEQLGAAMDNVLLHQGGQMPPADAVSRRQLVRELEELLA
ncbi:hypothetical protein [Cupriavidus sp. RAF12]|uniref:hypothetical protein n=1 Tax=Cupriavidus sp. RAF12 TaxID=3233050 RepID=UPI003F8F2BE0